MPEFWWADKQVEPVITGKRPGACVDKPPRAQAGGLLTRRPLGFGLWVQKAIRVGEGWLCSCDTTATDKMTLLCSTASFLPRNSEGHEDLAVLPPGTGSGPHLYQHQGYMERAVKTDCQAPPQEFLTQEVGMGQRICVSHTCTGMVLIQLV